MSNIEDREQGMPEDRAGQIGTDAVAAALSSGSVGPGPGAPSAPNGRPQAPGVGAELLELYRRIGALPFSFIRDARTLAEEHACERAWFDFEEQIERVRGFTKRR